MRISKKEIKVKDRSGVLQVVWRKCACGRPIFNKVEAKRKKGKCRDCVNIEKQEEFRKARYPDYATDPIAYERGHG